MQDLFTGKTWKFIFGFGIAFSLVTGPLSRVLLPQFQGTLVSSRDVQAVFFSVLGSLAVAALAYRVSVGVTWLVFGYLLSAFVTGYQGLTMATLQTLLWGVIILVILVEAWPKYKSYILFGLAVATTMHLVVAASQYFIEDYGWPHPAGLVWRDPFFLTYAAVHEVEGLTSQYSLLSAYLSVAMPLLWVRLGWPALVGPPIVIMALKHRSGMFAAAVAAFLSIEGWRRKCIAATLGLFLIGGVLVVRGSWTSHDSNGHFSVRAWSGDRMMLWTITAAKAAQHPWVGWGPGTFWLWRPTLVHERTKQGLTWLQAHNDFLQMFFETGFIGFFAVPLYIVTMWRRLRRVRPWPRDLRAAFAAVVAAAINAFVSFPMRIGVTGMLWIIALAALHGELGMEEVARK